MSIPETKYLLGGESGTVGSRKFWRGNEITWSAPFRPNLRSFSIADMAACQTSCGCNPISGILTSALLTRDALLQPSGLGAFPCFGGNFRFEAEIQDSETEQMDVTWSWHQPPGGASKTLVSCEISPEILHWKSAVILLSNCLEKGQLNFPISMRIFGQNAKVIVVRDILGFDLHEAKKFFFHWWCQYAALLFREEISVQYIALLRMTFLFSKEHHLISNEKLCAHNSFKLQM